MVTEQKAAYSETELVLLLVPAQAEVGVFISSDGLGIGLDLLFVTESGNESLLRSNGTAFS